MADISTDIAGTRQTDERVQVGSVKINLAAMGMNDAADIFDPLLENAVGRGIRDHQRSQIRTMQFSLRLEIVEVDVALVLAGDDDNPHACHMGAGGVGAMSRFRNEADIAVCIASVNMIATVGK